MATRKRAYLASKIWRVPSSGFARGAIFGTASGGS
jgi:hypothetical protein